MKYTWSYPHDKTAEDYKELYSYGYLGTPCQISNYVGSSGYKAYTGQWVKAAHTNPFLNHKHIFSSYYGDYSHIIMRSWWDRIKSIFNIRYLFHRLQLFINGISITKGQKGSFDMLYTYPDYQKSNQGQDIDVEGFISYSKKADDIKAHTNQIWLGRSRGASVLVQALHRSPIKPRLAILEGPYYDVLTAIKETLHWVIPHKWLNKCAKALYSNNSFWGRLFIRNIIGLHHNPESLYSPSYSAPHIPMDIPLIFVCSSSDMIVRSSITEKLAKAVSIPRIQALKKGDSYVAPVYFLKLKGRSHNNMATGNINKPQGQETLRYLCFTHKVREALGLPHIAEFSKRIDVLEMLRRDIVRNPLS